MKRYEDMTRKERIKHSDKTAVMGTHNKLITPKKKKKKEKEKKPKEERILEDIEHFFRTTKELKQRFAYYG